MTYVEAYERAVSKLEDAKFLLVEAQDFEGAARARELELYAKQQLNDERRLSIRKLLRPVMN